MSDIEPSNRIAAPLEVRVITTDPIAAAAAQAAGVEQHCTKREAAAVLRVQEQTIGLMLRRGQVRGVKLGKSWLIPHSEIRRLLTPK